MSDFTLQEKLAVAARCGDSIAGEALAEIERLQRENEQLNIACTNDPKCWAALQTEVKRLEAMLDRHEQYWAGRSHACEGRDCVGFWQEPTGSLPRCTDCQQIIDIAS